MSGGIWPQKKRFSPFRAKQTDFQTFSLSSKNFHYSITKIWFQRCLPQKIGCSSFGTRKDARIPLTNRSSRHRFVARFWALRYASPKPHHSRRGLTLVLGLNSETHCDPDK